MGIAVKKDGLYYLSFNQLPHVQVKVNTVKKSNKIVWHQRFGDLSERNLQRLAKESLVDRLDYHVSKSIGFCETCVNGKIHRRRFPTTGRKQGEYPQSLIHSDVCGKVNVRTLGGAEYFVTFIDDKTHFTWVYVLKHKHEVFQKFVEWKAMVERTLGHKVKVLHTNNGGEYTSTEFKEYLKRAGFHHELTIPKTAEQNRVAKRMNRTLMETVPSMLLGAKVPQMLG